MPNHCIVSHLTITLFSYRCQFWLFCPVSGFKTRLTLVSLYCREIKYLSVKKTRRKEHSITIRTLLVKEIFIHLKIYMHLEESMYKSRMKKTDKCSLSTPQIEGWRKQWVFCSMRRYKSERTESKNNGDCINHYSLIVLYQYLRSKYMLYLHLIPEGSSEGRLLPPHSEAMINVSSAISSILPLLSCQ